MANGTTLKRFGVSMRDDLLDRFDELIALKSYDTRSEAISDLVRRALAEETLTDDAAQVAATISLVYDHHVRNLNAKLTQFQHQALDIITSTVHVHLDERNCLEVLVVRGPYAQVRSLADQLISVKGVTHGKFITTIAEAGQHKHSRRSHSDKHTH